MIFNKYSEAIILGFIQGFSEFLPISSSGHLLLTKEHLLLTPLGMSFILVLHLGTLFAIFGYYKRELLYLLKNFLHQPLNISGPIKPLYLLFFALIPSIIGGFLLLPFVKHSFTSLSWTGFGFLFTGSFLFSTFFVLNKKNASPSSKKSLLQEQNTYNWEKLSFTKAFFIGIAQVLAFFPGMSRSGWTIGTALFLSVPKQEAVLFSFFLSIPTIIGGLVLEIMLGDFIFNYYLILGFFSSWFFGHVALKCLISSLTHAYFPFFSFYLWALAFTCFYI